MSPATLVHSELLLCLAGGSAALLELTWGFGDAGFQEWSGQRRWHKCQGAQGWTWSGAPACPFSPSSHTTVVQAELRWGGWQRHQCFGETDQKFITNEMATFHLLFCLHPALCVVFVNTLIRGYESLNVINKSSRRICPCILQMFHIGKPG